MVEKARLKEEGVVAAVCQWVLRWMYVMVYDRPIGAFKQAKSGILGGIMADGEVYYGLLYH